MSAFANSDDVELPEGYDDAKPSEGGPAFQAAKAVGCQFYETLLSSRLEPWVEIAKHCAELKTINVPIGDHFANMADPEKAAVMGFALGVRGLAEWCLARPKGDPIRAEVLLALTNALADGRVKLVCPTCGGST